MKDLDCSVIKDLMPSYLDAICSEESRNLVDAHLKNCEQCRAQLELLKSVKLTDEQGGAKRISYFKKIKRHYIKKEVLSILLLTIAIMGGFLVIQDAQMPLGINLLYLSFPFVQIGRAHV